MSPRDADVLIVGGGPAGAHCAWMLARRGASITLADAGRGVRGTELLSGRARRRFSAEPSLGGRDVASVVSLWGTASPTVRSAMTNPQGAGLAVDRPSFDASLRERARLAGVELLSGTSVETAVRENGTWRISMHSATGDLERRAGALILASGRRRDRVLRRTHEGSVPEEVALLAVAAPSSEPDDAALYVEAGPDGWWYSLPTEEGERYVGWCAQATRMQKGLTPAGLLTRALAQTRLIRERVDPPLSGVHGRRGGSMRWSRCSGAGWLAIGDAAFAPDPLSGTGLEAALATAEAAADALAAGDDAGGRLYAQWLENCAETHSMERAHLSAMA